MALIDTHKVVKEFIAVGLKENQAEAITHVISNIDEKLATKADIARLESVNKADISRLESGMKADISRLEDKIDINMKWLIGIGMAILLLLVKMAFFN